MAAPQWSFYLARPSGPNIGAATAATTRKLSWYLDAAAVCAFTMPGAHPQTAQIDELAVDVLCSRDGVNLFRGRVGGSNDTLTADADTTAFTATDYRGVLARRIMWTDADRSFRQADQADIAWQFIADTQAEAGGNLGIVRGAAPATGVLRDRDYNPGQNVADALTNLGDCLNGFDWEIDANRNFNLFYPQRGRQTGLVLAYGRDIVEVHRTIDPTRFANAVFYTGANTTTPVETAVTSFDPDIGRWDEQKSDPSVVLQQTVTDQADGELDAASVFDPSFSVTLAAGSWDPTTLWVGDTAQLIIQAGRLNVNMSRRIIQIDVTLDDDGGETVVLSVADAVPVLTNRLTSYNTRLNTVERALGYIPDAPVGAMFDWPGSSLPQLFAWADGSALSRAAYPDLFAVIGTTFGPGDGSTTFNLPDCRGRMTVAAGTSGGLTDRVAGSIGGAETVSLSGTQTGTHAHAIASVATGNDTPDHGHSFSVTSGNPNQSHTHQYNGYAFIGLTQGGYGVNTVVGTQANTSTESVEHTHVVSGATAGASAAHHHVQPAANTDTGGTVGAAHENMPPWIAIGKVIKVLSAQSA
jgi:microcystin-dependent protein